MFVDMKRYYDTNLPDIASQAAHPAALCSALIENNALQLISDQNSQWRLHAPKQVHADLHIILFARRKPGLTVFCIILELCSSNYDL